MNEESTCMLIGVIIGIILAAAVFCGLIIPAIKKDLNQELIDRNLAGYDKKTGEFYIFEQPTKGNTDG